jgi:hypothetical protein
MELKVAEGQFKFIGTRRELQDYLSDICLEERKIAEAKFDGNRA